MRAGPRTETPSVAEWLTAHLPERAEVGMDGAITPVWFWRKLADGAEAAGASLVTVPNLVAAAWPDRPGRPTAPVAALEKAGESTREKLARIREALARKKRADAVLFSRLDDVAWVLNARGGDVPYTPVFFAYLLVENGTATCFSDKDLQGVLHATCRLRRTARCWPGWRAWQSGWTPGRPWRCETRRSARSSRTPPFDS